MSRDKLVDVNDPYMHVSVNVGCQGKSGPGKIHEVILVLERAIDIARTDELDRKSVV